MKLYMTPGSCSTGIHILLEEIDLPFEAYIVNLLAGDHNKPDFVAINPKSSIPTLVRDDGTALTEFQAIAYWLARSNPKAGFWPEDLEAQTRVIETMDYVVGTIHGQGYTRIFTADNYTANPAEHAAIKTRGHEIVIKCFAVMNEALAGREYIAGKLSIADVALFYVEFWADKIKIELPVNCLAHYQRLLARPAVQRVLREEGYR